MTCWTGSGKERVSTQAGCRFLRRSSCDWTEPACVRPGEVETHAPHAGPTVVSERMEMKPNRLAVAVALSPLSRTDDEHPPSYSAKACRQLYERGPRLSQVADPSSCALFRGTRIRESTATDSLAKAQETTRQADRPDPQCADLRGEAGSYVSCSGNKVPGGEPTQEDDSGRCPIAQLAGSRHRRSGS